MATPSVQANQPMPGSKRVSNSYTPQKQPTTSMGVRLIVPLLAFFRGQPAASDCLRTEQLGLHCTLTYAPVPVSDSLAASQKK